MDIKAALIQYNAAIEDLEAAELKVQVALAAIKVASGSATVNVSGQFFQVRDRKDKLYLCELTGKPRGRPKGSKNSKPRVGSKRALTAETAGVGSDTADIGADTADIGADTADIGAELAAVVAEISEITEMLEPTPFTDTAEIDAITEDTGTFVISSRLTNNIDATDMESVG